jgi:hypothetical protein
MPRPSILLGLLVLAAPVSAADADPLAFFEAKIRPVLAENCYECHSTGKKQKGGLLLDTKGGWEKGGDTGPALTPGNVEKSLLIQAIRHTDPDLAMPPKKKLSDAQIADLEAWVKMGAPDPRTAAAAPTAFEAIQQKAKTHWSYQSLPPLQKVDGHPIDALLAQHGNKPAPAVDTRSLARRLYFDLLGLPPTADEVDQFAADASADRPAAVAKLVAQLLASPRYGERWGRHWLDVARYADNTGTIFGDASKYPYAWTYRDWVIRALNEDVPYDRFVKLQIAADLQGLPANDNRDLAALGFLTVGRRPTGGVDDDVIDDRIDVLTRGLMGLTVTCARCHDHKREPISSKDYYALYGVLMSCKEPDALPRLIPEMPTPEAAAFATENEKLRRENVNAVVDAVLDVLPREHARLGSYLLAVHDGSGVTTGKNAALKTTLLKDRNLNHQLYDQLVEAKPAWWSEHMAVLKPWIELSRVKPEEFAATAAELSAKYAANCEGDLAPEVVELFSGVPPKDLKELAIRYDGLFAKEVAAWITASQPSLDSARELKKEDQDSSDSGLKNAVLQRVDAALWAAKPEDGDACVRLLRATESPLHMSPGNLQATQTGLFTEAANKKIDEPAKKIKALADHPGAPARAMVLAENTPYNGRVFVRGNPKTPGDAAPRQFPSALRKTDAPPFPKDQSGRKELADAIASRDNPLTARVIVNRVWGWHFGEPLVGTPSDFGLSGEKPGNPELLDYLAEWFIENGWSLKKLHTLILTSAAWQQAGTAEGAALFTRAGVRPLDFEALRDAILAVAGKLDFTAGGRPTDLTQSVKLRRTVYGFVDRKTLPGLFRAFDFPDPSATAARRRPTALTPQALFMLNSPFMIDCARSLAAKARAQAGTDEPAAITALYRAALQRSPTEKEMTRARAFLAAYPQHDIVEPEATTWSYGFGDYDATAKAVRTFTALTQFADKKVRGIKKDGIDVSGMELTPEGGKVAKDRPAIRRWTAPRDGKVKIYAELTHTGAAGDGVTGRIVHSRLGALGEWTAQKSSVLTMLDDVDVHTGDTLDFVIDSRGNDQDDVFRWAPTITMPGVDMPALPGMAMRWDARTDFMDPAKMPQPLGAWDELAQVLLLSNEFAFVD